MPYIKDENRTEYYEMFKWCPEIKTKGELEFVVFKLMKKYMENKEYRYTILHDCVYGVVHSAHEFERRFLDKREDEAIKENGDIS